MSEKKAPAPRPYRPQNHPNSIANLEKGRGVSTAGRHAKFSGTVKAAISLAFEAITVTDDLQVDRSGMDAFIDWAQKNQTVFYTQIWARLLPTEVKAEVHVTSNLAERLEQALDAAERARVAPPLLKIEH